METGIWNGQCTIQMARFCEALSTCFMLGDFGIFEGAARSNLDAVVETIPFQALSSSTLRADDEGMDSYQLDTEDEDMGRLE